MAGNAGWVNWEGYLVNELGASRTATVILVRGVLLLGRANEHED